MAHHRPQIVQSHPLVSLAADHSTHEAGYVRFLVADIPFDLAII